MSFEVLEGGASSAGSRADIPAYVSAQPSVSSLFTVDDRVPFVPLIRALSDAGYVVVNLRDGKLVITQKPQDFLP